MSTYLYRLHFRGPLHLGLHGIGLEAVEERLSSDTLTSALINAFKVIEGEEEANKVVQALLTPTPPFILSSLFPFGPDPKNPGSITEAVVRPLVNPPVADSEILHRQGKDLKRISYLSVEDFRSWIGEKVLNESQIKDIIDRSKEFTKNWWYEELRPRVAIDRSSYISSIWNQAAIWFRREGKSQDEKMIKEAGLYGLIRFHDEQWKGRIGAAFRMLGDMGLGGERTYGLGLFQFGGFESLTENWKALFSDQSKTHIFLSMYYPSEKERQELQSCLQAWETVERRGYIVSGRNTTTIKRKRIRMIIEGSVTCKLLCGEMVDVTPDRASDLGIPHRIYRSGLAFLVPGGRM